MATQVDMKPHKNENAAAFLRRFSRAFRETRITQLLRSTKTYKRKPSDLKRSNRKLRRIEDSKRYTKLRKEGKIEERRWGRGRNTKRAA